MASAQEKALNNGWSKKTIKKVKAKRLGSGGHGFSYKDLK